MSIEYVDLELIHDNPYQARLTYHKKDIDELAHSIKTHGLLQVPPGRRVDGKVELGFGHLRKRAFAKLAKKDPEKWSKMPIDIRELTDEQMALFALEENLKRRDITPLETARAVDKYLNNFPEKTEGEVAEYLNMSQANVSHMRRVLRLPEEVLQKIDEGRISFTQGRELLVLEKLENPKELMLTAIRSIRTEGRPYGHPNTVEGIQEGVHDVVGNHCRPLDKQWEGYRWDLLFDTRAAGCLECEKMIRTHPTKSSTAHYCLDETCWERHQQEHRERAAAEAKARMEADILRHAAESVSVEVKEDITQVIKPSERTIYIDQDKFGEVEASYSADKISEGTAVRKPVEFEGKLYTATGITTEQNKPSAEVYQLVPLQEFTGKVRTYKVPQGQEEEEYYESLRNDPNGFYHGILVKRGGMAHVLVGPPSTFVVREGKAAVEKRKPVPVVADATGVAIHVPCDSCAKAEKCDRTHFHVAGDGSGLLVCENKVEQVAAPEEVKPVPPPQEIPEDILALAREKAGTRAEVLDLNDICTGERHWREVKQGYAILQHELSFMDEPEECLERCTHGFHYAFDSKAREQKEIYICSDTKCLAKKKGAFTRKKNAEGLARKNAERKAIQEAIAGAERHPRGMLMLLLYAQIWGKHIATYYYGDKGKSPEKWLWDKVSAGTKETDRTLDKLMARLDKLDEPELRKILLEMMFYYLTDHGDTGTYEIKTEKPLQWLGVDIQLEKGEHTPAEVTSGQG